MPEKPGARKSLLQLLQLDRGSTQDLGLASHAVIISSTEIMIARITEISIDMSRNKL
jgi:hypothetical protein